MNAITPTAKPSVIVSLATRYGIDPKKLEDTLRKTVMPNPHTDEEFAACCIVANEHKLNPLTKEIYFMRTKGGAIQPIVGVDGWIKKCNEHPAFDGIDFVDNLDNGNLVSITARIYRKDRRNPIVVTEYLAECRRQTDAWKMAARMLRHRALIQCARVAFGFAGIMDPDEFDQWQESYRGERARDITPAKQRPVALELPEEGNAVADPATAELPATDTRPSDAQFLDSLESAMMVAGSVENLLEVWEHNEAEISDRGLEQAAEDLRDHHMTRVRAAQNKSAPQEPEGSASASLDLPEEPDAEASALAALDKRLASAHNETQLNACFRRVDLKAKSPTVVARYYALFAQHKARVKGAAS